MQTLTENPVDVLSALRFLNNRPSDDVDKAAQRAVEMYVSIGFLGLRARARQISEPLDLFMAQMLCVVALERLGKIRQYDFIKPPEAFVPHSFFEMCGSMSGPPLSPEQNLAGAAHELDQAERLYEAVLAANPELQSQESDRVDMIAWTKPGSTDIDAAIASMLETATNERRGSALDRAHFIIITDGDGLGDTPFGSKLKN